jgi:Lrp/AsnC family transcriptional regulator, leucine-responsive regulatory protein
MREMRNFQLDSFDRRLLALVQEDADVTADFLSSILGLSPSAVLRRLKRLKAEKIITGTVAVVDHRQVGKPTFFVVSLEVERDRPEHFRSLRQWIDEEPQIQECFYVTGTADFIIIICTQNVESYDDLMSRLVVENQNVRRFTTNVVLNTSKRGLAIPI